MFLSVTALALRRSFTGFAGKLPSSQFRIYFMENDIIGTSRERVVRASRERVVPLVLLANFGR